MMEAFTASETSVNVYETTRRSNPGDSRLVNDYLSARVDPRENKCCQFRTSLKLNPLEHNKSRRFSGCWLEEEGWGGGARVKDNQTRMQNGGNSQNRNRRGRSVKNNLEGERGDSRSFEGAKTLPKIPHLIQQHP